MGLNETPAADRIHIGIFGKRNAGKSSVINAITGQKLAIVSDVLGTTTDPVYKSMELLPLGPVVLIDTPGIDDEGALGKQRVGKSYQVLNKTDIALLIVDGTCGMDKEDALLLKRIQDKKIPYLIVKNKMDQAEKMGLDTKSAKENEIWISCSEDKNIYQLKERIAALVPKEEAGYPIVKDLLRPNDFVILVVPIDSAAPKGRLILPQQQTIRDILEANACAMVVKETELRETLKNIGKKPKLVITDSQAFSQVARETPEDILLTSFSILFARHKGSLNEALKGAFVLDLLKDGDKILISEGCTHHRQCGDIGTVKLPNWIKEYTGKELSYTFTSGTEFPEDLSQYALIIHCGGCMLNEREMKYRIQCAKDQKVPITNYGTAISHMKGILKRSIQVFSNIYDETV